MSVEGPIEPPLRLGDLSNIESPDVVRAALSRFRRRTAVWSFWIAGAIVAGLLLLPSYNAQRNDPRSVFLRAPGVSIGAVIKQGSLRAILLEVVRLNKAQFGMHFIVTDEALKNNETIHVALPAPLNTSWTGHIPDPGFEWGTRDGKATEMFFVGSPGRPVVNVPIAIVELTPGISQSTNPPQEKTHTLTMRFDLRLLNVPSWIWR